MTAAPNGPGQQAARLSRWAGHPLTVNNAAHTAFAAETVADVFSDDTYQVMAYPEAAAEDFSWVLGAVPGYYLMLGAASQPDYQSAPANHRPRATFSDDAVRTRLRIHASTDGGQAQGTQAVAASLRPAMSMARTLSLRAPEGARCPASDGAVADCIERAANYWPSARQSERATNCVMPTSW